MDNILPRMERTSIEVGKKYMVSTRVRDMSRFLCPPVYKLLLILIHYLSLQHQKTMKIELRMANFLFTIQNFKRKLDFFHPNLTSF